MTSVNVLDPGSSNRGARPGWGHCVVFLRKTPDSLSSWLHMGAQIGTDKFNAGKKSCIGLASHSGKS